MKKTSLEDVWEANKHVRKGQQGLVVGPVGLHDGRKGTVETPAQGAMLKNYFCSLERLKSASQVLGPSETCPDLIITP